MRLQLVFLLLLLLLPVLESNFYTAAHPWQRRPGISRFSSVKIAFKVCHRTEARIRPGPAQTEACPVKLRPIVVAAESCFQRHRFELFLYDATSSRKSGQSRSLLPGVVL
uniref:Putative secreted peptide n=1 Tax=Anopheles braziliensis TaxID=58242 RepID=A0A2M3ZXC3_9DIPT